MNLQNIAEVSLKSWSLKLLFFLSMLWLGVANHALAEEQNQVSCDLRAFLNGESNLDFSTGLHQVVTLPPEQLERVLITDRERLAQIFAHVTTEGWADLIEQHGARLAPILNSLFLSPQLGQLPKVELTWLPFLTFKSLTVPNKSALKGFLENQGLDLSLLEQAGLSEPEGSVFGNEFLLEPSKDAFLWSEVFRELALLRAMEKPLNEKWIEDKTRIALLLRLYGALSEAWLRDSETLDIPGAAIRVNHFQHADAWKVSLGAGGELIIEGLREVKTSIQGFHDRGRHQIFSFLRRLLEIKSELTLYGVKIDPKLIYFKTRLGVKSLDEVRALFWNEEFFGKPELRSQAFGHPRPGVSDSRWEPFAFYFEEIFGPEFYQVTLPSDEVPLVAEFLADQDRFVGTLKPARVTLAENRQRFVEVVTSLFGRKQEEQSAIYKALFKSDEQKRQIILRRELAPRKTLAPALMGEDPIPVIDRERLAQKDYGAILEEVLDSDSAWRVLKQHPNKLDFFKNHFLPQIGWRALFDRPGQPRPLILSENSLTLGPSSHSALFKISWTAEVLEPFMRIDEGEIYHLQIPTSFVPDLSFPSTLNREMIGHDLQRFTASPQIQEARLLLGEPRIFLKPGQIMVVNRFKSLLEQSAGEKVRLFVSGPTAYGKTYILLEALKELMRRNEGLARKVSFVVTRKKHIVSQIAGELGKINELDLSAPVDFEFFEWGKRLSDFPDLEALLRHAKTSNHHLVVAVNWDLLSGQMSQATSKSPQAIKGIKAHLAGIWIDEAAQLHEAVKGEGSYRRTINTLIKDNEGIVLWDRTPSVFMKMSSKIFFMAIL